MLSLCVIVSISLTLTIQNLTKLCRDYLHKQLHNCPSLSLPTERLTCQSSDVVCSYRLLASTPVVPGLIPGPHKRAAHVFFFHLPLHPSLGDWFFHTFPTTTWGRLWINKTYGAGREHNTFSYWVVNLQQKAKLFFIYSLKTEALLTDLWELPNHVHQLIFSTCLIVLFTCQLPIHNHQCQDKKSTHRSCPQGCLLMNCYYSSRLLIVL